MAEDLVLVIRVECDYVCDNGCLIRREPKTCFVKLLAYYENIKNLDLKNLKRFGIYIYIFLNFRRDLETVKSLKSNPLEMESLTHTFFVFGLKVVDDDDDWGFKVEG
ncbi:hypothetical protein Ddye_018330 [Dipteronia dyeriana]|uniref:Uncharacterized protein n=1 Tax=Dipteronia dyeriana TaxID=168575 RepID=A0AAD9UAV1_9ROSI|nr:hypothetical protein Ddye_018330 [Dipteronia dyeriana]